MVQEKKHIFFLSRLIRLEVMSHEVVMSHDILRG